MNEPIDVWKSEFLLAHSILFSGVKNRIDTEEVQSEDGEGTRTVNTRDHIFSQVLKEFYPEPIRVFQVGAIETFKSEWRIGSGWSDLIFGAYINAHGGRLTLVDINLDHLANSTLASHALQYPVEIMLGDAIDAIGQGEYDIYYLDGGNDPQETLDQFNKIKDKKCVVLVDDFSIKGTLLSETDYDFTVHDAVNGFGVLDLRNQE